MILSPNEITHRIQVIRRKLGKNLLILGHHYQCDDVLALVDLQGDSFQLSAAAAQNMDCETILFCGVHFMAETADILANSAENLARRGGKRVNVLLPDLQAGCSMADMASQQTVEQCWSQLADIVDINDVVPITYVNSTAELKAFCGRHGGFACTSTNAQAVLDAALKNSRQALFFPDQHLGRNTALKMGLAESEIYCLSRTVNSLEINAHTDWIGNDTDQIRMSRIILWGGYCSVHQKFLPEGIDSIRKKHRGVRVIVHPECCRKVVEKADEFGSTSYILGRISESPAGSVWAVGTEARFVNRLVQNHRDKTILHLSTEPSYCKTMGLIDLPKLLSMLESIESGQPKNVIRVEPSIAADALLCLQRMLKCV